MCLGTLKLHNSPYIKNMALYVKTDFWSYLYPLPSPLPPLPLPHIYSYLQLQPIYPVVVTHVNL